MALDGDTEAVGVGLALGVMLEEIAVLGEGVAEGVGDWEEDGTGDWEGGITIGVRDADGETDGLGVAGGMLITL